LRTPSFEYVRRTGKDDQDEEGVRGGATHASVHDDESSSEEDNISDCSNS
jgi:hypothetical protein